MPSSKASGAWPTARWPRMADRRDSFAGTIGPARIVVCVGTGGVGKTTAAAAIALAAAREGRRAVVVTIDPARRLAQALGLVIVLQLATGAATVFFDWPLALAVAHNAGAALLVLLLVVVNYLLSHTKASTPVEVRTNFSPA